MTDTCTYLGNSIEPCGCAVVPGRSYCEQHLWVVYQKGTAKRRRKDTRIANNVWDIENALNEAIEELQEEGFDI